MVRNRIRRIGAAAVLAAVCGIAIAPASRASDAAAPTLAPRTAPDAPSTNATHRRAVELTYLRSNPGDRERLRRFIVLNWFAMDAIAKARGLMADYTVLDTGTDDGEWNVLVAVTYADERGYDGIAAEFEAIRRAHAVVPVDGRTLRELGTIVRSQRVYEYAADSAR